MADSIRGEGKTDSPSRGKSIWRTDLADGEEEEEEEDEDEENVHSSLPVSFGKVQPISGSSVGSLECLSSRSEGKRSQHIGRERADHPELLQRRVGGRSDASSSDITRIIPCQYDVSIPAHTKSVRALSINPKGSRMITGGADYFLRMWDFNAMTTAMRSCKQLEPVESHSIHALSYSNSGAMFLCAAGDSVCRLYDVDAKPIQKTVVGDMYIRDTANTKGHTHTISDCLWHSTDRNRFITCSLDATVRIFDVNAKVHGIDQALPHAHCMKAIDKRGLNISKCHVLCIAMTPADNTAIVAGCVDGSIQMWGEKRSFGKPISVVREAHTDEVTAVKLCSDSRHMFSRSSDGSMKAWDIRKFKEAIHVWGDIPLPFLGGGSSSIGLSPNDRLVFTGVANASTPSSSSNNSLNFYSTDSFEVKHTLTFPSLSLGPVAWPQELDQLVVGCADGSILMLYDPGISRKGALLFISRMPAQPRNDPIGHKEPIFVPEDFASQNFKELRDGGLRKVNPRSSQGIVTQQKTIPPIRPSVGFRGMEVTTRETFAEQAKGDNRSRPTILDEDPVEVLRSYDALVKADPRYVDRAYKHTQPSPILDWSMEATEGEQRLDEISICPKCGLKMCCCGFMASQNEEGDQDTNNKRRKQQ